MVKFPCCWRALRLTRVAPLRVSLKSGDVAVRRCGRRGCSEAGVARMRSAFHRSWAAPEQANAADRIEGGFHPQGWMLVALCAGRLIGSVMPLYRESYEVLLALVFVWMDLGSHRPASVLWGFRLVNRWWDYCCPLHWPVYWLSLPTSL